MFAKNFIKQNLVRIFSILVIIILYSFAKSPEISEQEKNKLASEFKFTSFNLPEPEYLNKHHERSVHRSFDRISSWISAVGAAVAINDLDGDGYTNDICLVDPRYDKVIIFPAPGTAERYKTFILNEYPIEYDSMTIAPMGVVPCDFNEDGQMDLLVYYWGRTPIIFLQDNMNFKPTELTSYNERWFSNACAIGDIDGDGHNDIILGNYFSDGSRILDANSNDDEQHMQHSMSFALNGSVNRIFLLKNIENNIPQYTEAKDWLDGEDVQKVWTLAIGMADLNGDLFPEIYIANDFGPDNFYYNLSTPGKVKLKKLFGQRNITTPKSSVLGRDSFKGMGVDFGDVNRDGLLDIHVSNIAGEYSLEESHFCFVNTGRVDLMKDGIAPFENKSEELGLSRSSWAWDCRFGDFNNDGILEAVQATGFMKGNINRWPELHELAMSNDELISNPSEWPNFKDNDDLSGHEHNPFFVQNKNGIYFDLASSIGIDGDFVTRGIAAADVNNDGKLDFAIANQWEPSVLFINNSTSTNSYLQLEFFLPLENNSSSIIIDPQSNIKSTNSIGTQVEINLPDGKKIVDYVKAGNGHSGKSSNGIHVGLGNLSRESNIPVKIFWRNKNGVVRNSSINLTPGSHKIYLY